VQLLRIALLGTISAGLVYVAGCGVPPEPTLLDPAVLKPSAQQAEQGLVWMFPGLIGVPWELGPAYRGLRDAGLDKDVQFFQWDIPAPDFLAHLTRYEDNVVQAQEVADHIVKYRKRYPEQPIDLIGYSAGGFMALLVTEQLPPEVHVRNVILAQPAVSPSYDLTHALEHVGGKLINFYCERDWALSGAFTQIFGTMDRCYVSAAGMKGFKLDAAVADADLRERVEQVPWTPAMAVYGHPGNHIAILQYRWNKFVVAPYLVDPEDLRIEPAAIGGNAQAGD
jgi:pimeloyl-ACP methyl ester carboxylesterase